MHQLFNPQFTILNPQWKRGSVLAMGTFDGVHRGHQAVLKKAAALARRSRRPSLAVTFARPPRLFFSPQPGPQLLTLPQEKIPRLRSLGIRSVRMFRFGKPLARLSAEEFFQRYVLRRFKAQDIVVGYNFKFGRGRAGTPELLKRWGELHGVRVHIVPPVRLKGVPVSSGQIRQHLAEGDLAPAVKKLGHPYGLKARVVRGKGLGRRLGFPTANLKVEEDKIVPPGVFAVKVVLPGGKVRTGMCNVGFRPTLGEPRPRRSVEVHVLGFKGELAGKTLDVIFVKKIRDEKKFPSLENLARQLRRDEKAVRRIFRDEGALLISPRKPPLSPLPRKPRQGIQGRS